MKKIVITGGTGLIGRALVNRLVREKSEIVILSRSPKKHQDEFGEKVNLVHWDGRSMGEWAKHIDGAAAVVNLAGESISGSKFLPDRWNAEKKKRIMQSRINVGQALVMAIEAAQSKPKTLVQASAVGYYGSTGDTLITELSPPGDDFLSSVTRAWEASTAAVEDLGVRRTVARIGLVLSMADGALPRLVLPARLFAGGWFGSGNQWWPWIHIADVTNALQYLIDEESARGIFNLSAPNPVTNKEFGQALGHVMNRPSLLPVPGFALRIALGEVASTILEGQRAVPQHLIEMGYNFRFPEINQALADLMNE
ncbi:MAG: TIGR01777 family oxidoreductase [Candidatus Promineifilaceae bacterium]|jgi:uncharacterized protein (TIGR01777 family)